MTGHLHNPFGNRVYTAYGYYPEAAREGQLAFTGQWLDGGARGYLLGNGHRLFKPELMRFTGPDGLSPFGKGGVNGYTYCEGDPVNRADPSGRVSMWKLFRIRPKTGVSAAAKKLGLDKSVLKQHHKKTVVPSDRPTEYTFSEREQTYIIIRTRGEKTQFAKFEASYFSGSGDRGLIAASVLSNKHNAGHSLVDEHNEQRDYVYIEPRTISTKMDAVRTRVRST